MLVNRTPAYYTRRMPRFAGQVASLLVLVILLSGCKRAPSGNSDPSSELPCNLSDQFSSLRNAGRNYMEQGDATNALAAYKKAEVIAPNDVDLRLNLANAWLMAANAQEAMSAADEV